MREWSAYIRFSASFFQTATMDAPLSPPLRIQPISETPLSTRMAQKTTEAFLQDFQSRSTSSQGGNTAVTVQLQKLVNALKEERKKSKKDAWLIHWKGRMNFKGYVSGQIFSSMLLLTTSITSAYHKSLINPLSNGCEPFSNPVYCWRHIWMISFSRDLPCGLQNSYSTNWLTP